MKTKPAGRKKKSMVTVDGDLVHQAYHLERVHAMDNVTVVAHDKSTILAAGNSFVRAYDSSTVIATERSTIIVFSEDANIELHDFAVLVDRIDEKPIVHIARSNVVNLFTEDRT